MLETQEGGVASSALDRVLGDIVGSKQAKWLLNKLGAGMKLVPLSFLESAFSALKTRVYKENEVVKSLRRLKSLIQDTLRISLLEAFYRMTPKDSQNSVGLTKEQIKSGLMSLGLELNLHEINTMLAAFDTDEKGLVTAFCWTSVICSVQPANRKPQISPKTGSPRSPAVKAIPLSGNFSICSAQAFGGTGVSSRPSTSASLLQLHRSMSPRLKTDDSGFISEVNTSKASSLQPPLDAQAILSVPPGPRLVQAAKMLTNLSAPVTPLDEERLMRSLGSHVYSGPGRQHEILGQVDAGGVVTVRKTAGPWAKVAVGTMEGWVPLQHLDSTLDRKVYKEKDCEVQDFPASRATAIATVYLRQEPGWEGRAIRKLKPGEVTEVLGGNNRWLKVLCTSGYKGWIPQAATDLNDIHPPPPLANTHSSPGSHTSTPTPPLQKWLDTMKPALLSKETQQAFAYRIETKMAALGETQYQDLGERLRKRQFRMRLISSWMHLATSRAFG